MYHPFRIVRPPRHHAVAPAVSVTPPAESRATGDETFTYFYRGPFSQWHPSRFEIDGISYSHAEQWMMAEKARLFGDMDALRLVMMSGSPAKQKAIGRDVRGFVEEVWVKNARPIVRKGSRAKYTQDDRLLRMLMATEGTTLVEASPRDRIWGIGLAESDPRARSRSTWLGPNWLGEELTGLREELSLEMATVPRPA